MIEELKLVLDSIGDLTGVALWVVGFFIAFKLIVYLSTTGAVVFLVKLFIEKTHDVLTREKTIKHKYKEHFIDEEAWQEFDDILCRLKIVTGNYIHSSDLRKLKQALEEISKD